MTKLLYEEMGLERQYNHKRGTLSTGKEALMKLRRKLNGQTAKRFQESTGDG
jgi:DNA polymerase I-like protein with 3'-5' exonuclease and polymerase domains